MEFNISTEMGGDIVIIDIVGSLVASSIEELRSQVSKLIEKKYYFVLLDMSNVHLIDSYGITVCITFYKMMESRGGRLLFIKPSQAVEKVFRITHADQKFHIVNDKDKGIKSIREKMIKTVEDNR